MRDDTKYLKKLAALLHVGITDEAQVIYLMSGVRKLLEQQQTKKQYQYLTFHCDWTLHSKLEGPAAQDVLQYFEAANAHLKTGVPLHQLPSDLRREIDNISQMKHFEKELDAFLQAHGLPGINATRTDGWIHFLHLYAQVVEDCPLVIAGKNHSASGIESVTVHLELAHQSVGDEMPFKVTWTILDKNGLSGDIFIINSFSLSESSQTFLARIGPRPLTDAEARQLHILRIREGKASTITGVIARLAAEAECVQQHKPDDGATEHT